MRLSGTVLILLLLAAPAILSGQISFHKAYGVGLQAWGDGLLPLSDSSFVIAGSNGSNFDNDFAHLARLDAQGEVLWNINFVVNNAYDNGLYHVIRSNDGGFIAAGSFRLTPFALHYLPFIIKVDANGQAVWIKNMTQPVSIITLWAVPGGYLIGSRRYDSEGFIMRIDEDGDLLWRKRYNEPGTVLNIWDLTVQNDTIYLCGSYQAAEGDTTDACIMQVGLDTGGIYAAYVYRNLDVQHFFTNIFQTPDGQLLVGGYSYTDNPGNNHYTNTFQKIGKNGQVLSAQTMSDSSTGLVLRLTHQAADGGLILSNNHELVRLNADGSLRFARQYSRDVNSFWSGAVEAADGGVLACGYTGSANPNDSLRCWITKTQPDGQVEGCCSVPFDLRTEPVDWTVRPLSLLPTESPQALEYSLFLEDDLPFPGVNFCPDMTTHMQDTIGLCVGDSVQIGGVWYDQPGAATLTINGADLCDTVINYVIRRPPSSLSIQCPADKVAIIYDTLSAVNIDYLAPVVTTDCSCGGPTATLAQGLPSGGAFPPGVTTVCYQAGNDCGAESSCCFKVTVFQIPANPDSYHKVYNDGPANNAQAILALLDSGYVIAGANRLSTGPAVPALMRIDQDGQVVWLNRFPSAFGGGFSQVLRAEDGGFLAIGNVNFNATGSNQRILLVKTDAAGNEQWHRNLRYSAFFEKALVVPGGYLLTGSYTGNDAIGPIDGFLLRLDQDGEIVWTQEYGQPLEALSFSDVRVEGDTIFAVGNHSYVNGPADLAACLGRFSLGDGTLYSIHTYEDPGILTAFDHIFPTADGQFLIAGSGRQPLAGGQLKSYTTLQQISRDGTVQWSKKFFLDNDDLSLFLAHQTADKGLILAADNTLLKVAADAGIQYARQYSKEVTDHWAALTEAWGGGVMAAGTTQSGGAGDHIWLTRTLPDGRVANCCTAPLPVKAEDFTLTRSDLPVLTTEFIQSMQVPALVQIGGSLPVAAFCPEMTTFAQDTLRFCAGTSVEIGGIVYNQPGVVTDTLSGIDQCDTVVTYVLQVVPQISVADTLRFCPGASVTIGGTTYTQPGTVLDTLPSVTGGCDTVVTYTLLLLPQVSLADTLEFCPGDSVFVAGAWYDQPGTVVETVPGAAGACDTLRAHNLQFVPLPQPSAVTLQCPANVSVSIPAANTFATVDYAAPAAATDCPCGEAAVQLLQGLPSGGNFPPGVTNICFQAADDCGATAGCCFTVTVSQDAPQEACDIKVTPCIRFELLGIYQTAAGPLSYRMRVTNTCADPLVYAAFQLPDGLDAVQPANNSVYTAPSGRTYTVRNPNHSPQHSIRFKSTGPGIASGQSDIFEYSLPEQAAPLFIHAVVRLQQSQIETHLNTFGCAVQPENDQRTSGAPAGQGSLRVFPNPATEVLRVDLSAWVSGTVRLRLFDALGRQVMDQEAGAGAGLVTLELPGGAFGWHTLEATGPDGVRRTARFYRTGL